MENLEDFISFEDIVIPESSHGKKTYSELLNEISADELFDGLLGYGLFAEKIPPFLTTEKFIDFCKNPPNDFIFKKEPKKYIHYESMRNINVPRVMAIPNPIAYYNQCKALSDNWDKLLEYFKKQTKNQEHKISRIHIRKIDDSFKVFNTCYPDELEDINLDDYPFLEQKHLFEMNHKNFCKDDYPEPTLLIGKRYIVKADISNCFPSIYTHSLSWALVGKEHSKTNKKDDTKWFNQIDICTRNLKDGETHGILIGSHSSNLISEIILTAIDKVMYEKKYRYIRNIDDYTCYVETKEQAEQFLIDLSIELKNYSLMLNHKKTEILKLPLASTEHWIRKLNSFIFSSSDDSKLKLTEVRAYLDIALDLMFHNKENTAILNYAIKVLSKKEMTKNAKDYFIKTVHHLVLLYPYLIPLLDEKIFSLFSIDNAMIEKITQDIFKLGKDKKLYEAMSYALYFSLKYDFKLIEDLFEIVEKSNDAILLLLSYFHDKKFINHSAINKKYRDLAKYLKNDIDEFWVFVYEVLTVGNLKEEWRAMKRKDITFIKNEFLT